MVHNHPMQTHFRIAVIATEYRPDSHADVIVSRWLEPFKTDHRFGWDKPRTEIASIHVDQIPPNDTSAEICRRHGIPRFRTVEEALTLGGESLAVDAVMLIGEHGQYPLNAIQQKLYPRKELFDRVVDVFRRSGKVIPLFFDKHLSWNPEWIGEMYRTINELRIPFFGGSSLPFSPLSHEMDIPPKSSLNEVVAIYWHCVEPYLFHSLEFVQSVIERERADKGGVISITAWEDEDVWNALDNGAFSKSLLQAAASAVSGESAEALDRSHAERGGPVLAVQLLYGDGLRETHLMQGDLIPGWSLACRVQGDNAPLAATVHLGGREEFFPHFARLNRRMEDFFLSGVAPIGVERLYFTSLATAFCMQAIAQPGCPLQTPLLAAKPSS